MPECIRSSGHFGPHVFRTPKGVYVSWEDDVDCSCCEPDEEDPCYVYGEITEEQFNLLERK